MVAPFPVPDCAQGGSTRACPNRPRHGIIIVVPSALLRLGRPKGWLERQRRLQEPVWRAPRAGNTAPSLVWSWWHGSPVPAQHSWWWLFENRRASCKQASIVVVWLWSAVTVGTVFWQIQEQEGLDM
ncbi:unnamed protein product [Prorocentrum cordatum]|uniref:Uncharacterized protein n=1 Tax=Prorocentrum cordatum TaxID=2364126 RepID=A0ABN9YAJ9_9DINO|nr:unnamed protein product [Polarella glacialis]